MKKWLLLLYSLLLCCLFSSLVVAAGTCALDKYDYHPSETPLFSCSCTLPGEENAAGYMVWRNSTGDVLQNISADSGACRTQEFFSQYTLSGGITNYTGNVTFETAVIGWVGDTVSDDFNVTGASAVDCVITDIGANEPVPGDLAVIRFHVRDAITMNNLLNVQCSMSVYNVLGEPIYVHQDEITGDHFETTSTTGEVYFHHTLSERFWVSNQTYEAEFHCACFNNVNDSDTICYDETTGTPAGYNVCTLKSPLQLYPGDNREYGTSWGLAILVIGALFFLILLSKIINGDEWFHKSVKLLIVLLSVWVLVTAGGLGVSFANSIGASAATVATAQVFYKIVTVFAAFFTFLLLLYFIYEILMAFRIEKQKKKDDLIGK